MQKALTVTLMVLMMGLVACTVNKPLLISSASLV